MAISVGFPIAIFLSEFLTDYAYKVFDQCTLCPKKFPKNTKCKTIAQYV